MPSCNQLPTAQCTNSNQARACFAANEPAVIDDSDPTKIAVTSTRIGCQDVPYLRTVKILAQDGSVLVACDRKNYVLNTPTTCTFTYSKPIDRILSVEYDPSGAPPGESGEGEADRGVSIPPDLARQLCDILCTALGKKPGKKASKAIKKAKKRSRTGR